MLDAPKLIRASVQAGFDAFKPPPGLVARGSRVRKPRPLSAGATMPQMKSNALDADGVLPNLPHLPPAAPAPAPGSGLILPMRTLGPAQRGRVAQHLLALDERDRYLRFGYAANDEHILRYADGIDFDRDEIFGIYNRKLHLVAMAHLAFATQNDCEQCAEFGVSVLPNSRGKGYGSRLFERALTHARNEGVRMLFIHALSENTPMLAIARRHGADIERHGSETEAFLRLAPADWESRIDEAVDDSVGEIDFELKLQAKRFWGAFRAFRALRGLPEPAAAQE